MNIFTNLQILEISFAFGYCGKLARKLFYSQLKDFVQNKIEFSPFCHVIHTQDETHEMDRPGCSSSLSGVQN